MSRTDQSRYVWPLVETKPKTGYQRRHLLSNVKHSDEGLRIWLIKDSQDMNPSVCQILEWNVRPSVRQWQWQTYKTVAEKENNLGVAMAWSKSRPKTQWNAVVKAVHKQMQTSMNWRNVVKKSGLKFLPSNVREWRTDSHTVNDDFKL